MQIALARWATLSAYSTYRYAIAWTTVLSVIATMGFHDTVLRYVPIYRSQKRPNLLLGLLKCSERTVLAAGVVIFGLGSGILQFGFSVPTPLRHALTAGLLMVPLSAFFRLQTESCRAVRQVTLAFLFPRVTRPLTIIGTAALLVHGLDIPLTGLLLVAVSAAPLLPIALVQRSFFRRLLSVDFSNSDSAQETRTWLHMAGPMLLVAIFVTLLQRTDLLVIGIMLDSDTVGPYYVASRTAASIGFILSAFNAVLAPRFSSLYEEEKMDELQNLVHRAMRWLFGLSFLAAVLLWGAGRWILGFFGAAFTEVWPLLVLLSASHLISAGIGPVGYLLNMTGHQKKGAYVFGTCAVLNILLNVIGVSFFGLRGAAIATVVSTLLWNLWLHQLVARHLSIRASIFSGLLPFSSSSQ